MNYNIATSSFLKHKFAFINFIYSYGYVLNRC